MGFFSKKKSDDSISSKKNWYSDRYQTVLVQRNFFLLLTIISLAGIIISVMAVIKVTSSKTIEPFVIEIEEKTGITNVIRPFLKEQFSYNETLNRYFLTKYITSRETYNPGSYSYNYNQVTRLMSSPEVYGRFKRTIASEAPDNPIRKLGTKGQREIKIKSISMLKTPPGQKGLSAQVRFLSEDIGRVSRRKKHLVATINFDYVDMKLTAEERAINPLGFEVTGYSIDEENL